ncbi:hypothetical protein HPB49_020669 [Dermacentor silvarum]|uniref:Uncharacterized protein n=1 Tax=Dermacentor silvarum TaxID=543639 RepID=A0ACB8CZS7_DERSI|nr:hypothetical protein HPB49_020669 [Dermacentor silvarum]
MVEHLHRSLNASLKAQPGIMHGVASLPLVLLSLRATLKPDIRCTPEDWLLVGLFTYLTSFSIWPPHPQPQTQRTMPSNCEDFVEPSITFASQARTQLASQIAPLPLYNHSPSHITLDLDTSTHVFIRRHCVETTATPI